MRLPPLCSLPFFVIFAYSLSAAVTLDSLGTGTEGSAKDTDTTIFSIDASGKVADSAAGRGFDDFEVTGRVAEVDGFNSTFSFTIRAAARVDDSADIGAILKKGGIDRAGNGDIGVRDGDTIWIDALEGIIIEINTTGLDPSLSLRLLGIEIVFVGAPGVGTIVNRVNTDLRGTFGYRGSGADMEVTNDIVYVHGLNLTVRGGEADREVASIFGNDFGAGNFRIRGFILDTVPTIEP